MKQISKKLLAMLLCLVMLVTSVGCGYMILGCAALSCVTDSVKNGAENLQQSLQEGLENAIKEEIANALPETTDQPQEAAPTDAPAKDAEAQATPEPTAEPAPEPTFDSEADEKFLALDKELFTWYVTSGITTLDQYCYDPAAFGIDESTVPVTLGDLSEEEDDKWVAECREWLAKLKQISRDSLSEQNAFAYDNYQRYFELEIQSEGLHYQYEPFEQTVGFHLNLPLTFGLYEFKDKQDVENYLTLLADVPRLFDQMIEHEQKRAEMGIFMTETNLDAVLADFDSVVESRNDSYLFGTFREALEDVDWLTAEEKEAYYAKNDELVSGPFTDAYAKTRDALEELRPYCRRATGAANVSEDALRYFELELKSESGNNMTVDEAIAFLDDISEELYLVLMKASRMATSDDDSFTTGTLEGDEEYLKTLIPDIVPPMPEINVTYKEIPKELQDGFSPAAYLLPAVDNYTENTILINPASQTDLITLAHEGYPGHMFQYTYQYSLGTIPLFQFITEPIGYAEGWSTNAEYSVAKRARLFGVPNVTLSTINEELIITIITVCTLQVNGKGYSKNQMTEYLNDWGIGSLADVAWDYAVNMPTYWFKYCMGFCQQYSLTERCRAIYNFKDADFYAEYLSWGPSYFDILEPKLIAWAQEQSKKK